MKQEQVDYFNHIVNVMSGDGMTIGREIANSIECITISFDGKEVYKFWHNPKKKVSDKPPKHTGGKPSYVKVMLKAVQENKELSLRASGLLVKLAGNVRWSDNLLIDNRSKKALNAEQISHILNARKTETYEILSELKRANLLIKDKDGFKISKNLIQKGGVKHEDNNV